MKTEQEIREQSENVKQGLDQSAFDQDVHGIKITPEEVKRSEGYIQALEWVLA